MHLGSGSGVNRCLMKGRVLRVKEVVPWGWVRFVHSYLRGEPLWGWFYVEPFPVLVGWSLTLEKHA